MRRIAFTNPVWVNVEPCTSPTSCSASDPTGGGASTDPGTGGGSTNPTLDQRAPLGGFTAVLEASPTSPTSPTSGTSTSPVKGVTGTTSFTKLSSGTR